MAIVLRVFSLSQSLGGAAGEFWAGGASGVDGLELCREFLKRRDGPYRFLQPAITTPVRGKYSWAMIPWRLSFTSTQLANRSDTWALA